MIKGTPERIAGRREEIVNACEKLYQSMSFKDITLKEIGNEVPFSRPTIYNYFQTKEEIFLALFEREYDRWNADLEGILEANGRMTRRQIAEEIARSLEGRQQLLKLLAMNNYDMEANSRTERLTAFKASYGRAIKNVRAILERANPALSDSEAEDVIGVFFPFMFGLYPYTAVTEKQKAAMRAAHVEFRERTVTELVQTCLAGLLDAKPSGSEPASAGDGE